MNAKEIAAKLGRGERAMLILATDEHFEAPAFATSAEWTFRTLENFSLVAKGAAGHHMVTPLGYEVIELLPSTPLPARSKLKKKLLR